MAKKKHKKKIEKIIISIITILLIMLLTYINEYIEKNTSIAAVNYKNIIDVPEYTDKIYVTVNDNVPYFEEKDYTMEAFEKYSELDEMGRCGTAYANICKEIMPPDGDERGDISSVKPTGWVQKQYNGEYLYNRCHLIGYQLSDEDANKQNLITGTRYFNVSGMLPFENEVADYINSSKEDVHVLYRVTPIYKDDNLLASGVEIEAYSVEDKGEGICFNVFVYNVQPGININYKTGESSQ